MFATHMYSPSSFIYSSDAETSILSWMRTGDALRRATERNPPDSQRERVNHG